MKPTKQKQKTQENATPPKMTPMDAMEAYSKAIRAEYAVSTNPNVIFAQKPVKEMTPAEMQAEALGHFINM